MFQTHPAYLFDNLPDHEDVRRLFSLSRATPSFNPFFEKLIFQNFSASKESNELPSGRDSARTQDMVL
jgi:hypothetical protein